MGRGAAATGGTAASAGRAGPDLVELSLPFEPPLAAAQLLAWFRDRAVAGVVEVDATTLRRTLRLPGGPARVSLTPGEGAVAARFELARPDDLGAAVAACRRMLDLDAPGALVDRHLAADPDLAPLVRARPGLRVPGTADPRETALLAVIGQQISTAAARTLAGRLVARLGAPAGLPGPGPDRLFPEPARVADADLAGIGMPARRAACLRALAGALAHGTIDLGPGVEPAEVRRRLLALPGVGAWTADYILLRALADRDALPATDLVLRKRAAERGLDLGPGSARWRPWRAYAAQHLWVAGPG